MKKGKKVVLLEENQKGCWGIASSPVKLSSRESQKAHQGLCSKRAGSCGPQLWICFPPVAAKVKHPLQQLSFGMRVSAITINQFDASESFRTPQISVWMWHFQLQLCTHNLCTRFLWIRLLWHRVSRNSHTVNTSQLTGSPIPIWKLITTAFVPHWGRIHCKARVRLKAFPEKSFYFLSSFAFHSARELEINRNMKFLFKLKRKTIKLCLQTPRFLYSRRRRGSV